MSFDKKCKWHKSCGADLCHGEGVCWDFESKSQMIPKPKPKRKSNRNPIPQKLHDEVWERDKGICQYCGKQGVNIHHILFGGTGRRRIHAAENLITLCLDCHGAAHSSKDMREWTYEWSRKRYGNTIDKLLEMKWSNEK